MQDAIAAALTQKNFQRAADLLQQWKQRDAGDPQFLLMVGRYQEATDRWEAAERTYLKLLRQTPSQKIISQARQGIQRVQLHMNQARTEALAMARADPDNQVPGLLCLEPVQGPARQVAAQGLAKVMQIDPYMAGLQLPGTELRLYRVGPAGELAYFHQALIQAETPNCWVKCLDLDALQIFRIQQFRQVQGQADVVCHNAAGQLGAIAFAWSEVSQIVQGQLPLFESVVDTDAWRKLQRKEKTQDYAEVIDLHLHGRKCILRLCDRTYDFHRGNPLPNADAIPDRTFSTRPHWNALMAYLRQQVKAPIRKGFAKFGEGALEYLELLPAMNAHIHLSRLQPSHWDTAFHIYSGLYFLQYGPRQSG